MTPGHGDELVEDLGLARLGGFLGALAEGVEELGLGLRDDRGAPGVPSGVGNTPVWHPSPFSTTWVTSP
jgi:hypothetical protein